MILFCLLSFFPFLFVNYWWEDKEIALKFLRIGNWKDFWMLLNVVSMITTIEEVENVSIFMKFLSLCCGFISSVLLFLARINSTVFFKKENTFMVLLAGIYRNIYIFYNIFPFHSVGIYLMKNCFKSSCWNYYFCSTEFSRYKSRRYILYIYIYLIDILKKAH